MLVIPTKIETTKNVLFLQLNSFLASEERINEDW